MKKTYKKNNFSLIELLSVMVIAIILFGISIMAFNKMTKGQGVKVGARTLGSKIKAVRSYAIIHRKTVALVIPTTEADLPSEYLYKSYRACVVDNMHYQYCDFNYWVPGDKWEFMPTGTAILDVDATAGHVGTGAGTFLYGGSNQGIRNVNFSDIGGSNDTDYVKGIVFFPTGKPALRASSKFVAIGDAASLEAGAASTSNIIDISINSTNGRITYVND